MHWGQHLKPSEWAWLRHGPAVLTVVFAGGFVGAVAMVLYAGLAPPAPPEMLASADTDLVGGHEAADAAEEDETGGDAPEPAGRAAEGEQDTPAPFEGWVDPASVGTPYGAAVRGLLTFRGNPTRTFYGAGPVPTAPEPVWRYPREAMCSESVVGGQTREWCGLGWTGQPAVFERDGRTWVVFGAYDGHVHFVDADTGQQILPSFPTGDLIKGSVTVDPDGFPIVYTGSRDNHYRAIAIDGDEPRELWSLWAFDVAPTLWNNDWDGAGLILDDYLFVGGENSQFHVVHLLRGYGEDGRVTLDPEVVFNAPGWDDELLEATGDHMMSIEGSVMVVGDTVYFANSGGLVQGWDITGLREGVDPERVFRFWTGDDTDATIVADDQGMLYVASQWERFTDRGRAVGQIMKLDPTRPDDPLVWSVHDRGTPRAGVWATPALDRDVLYVPTDGGRLLALDRATGAIRWEKQLAGPVWQSPVVVDDVLIQSDCSGAMRAYDVADTTVEPPELWTVQLDGCVEATPAVWGGTIYVGTRGGFLHAIADPQVVQP